MPRIIVKKSLAMVAAAAAAGKSGADGSNKRVRLVLQQHRGRGGGGGGGGDASAFSDSADSDASGGGGGRFQGQGRGKGSALAPQPRGGVGNRQQGASLARGHIKLASRPAGHPSRPVFIRPYDPSNAFQGPSSSGHHQQQSLKRPGRDQTGYGAGRGSYHTAGGDVGDWDEARPQSKQQQQQQQRRIKRRHDSEDSEDYYLEVGVSVRVFLCRDSCWVMDLVFTLLLLPMISSGV